MKVLFVTPFRNHPGGVEVVNSMISKIIIDAGGSVEYLTSERETTFIEKIFVKFVGLPYITAKSFRKIENDFDLIITNGEFGFRINTHNAISIFHGSYFGLRKGLGGSLSLKAQLSLALQSLVQRGAAKNKRVITVSSFNRDVLHRQGIFVDQVIDNGVDTELFYPMGRERNQRFLFVGSNNYKGKGIDILQKVSSEAVRIDCLTPGDLPEGLKTISNIPRAELPDLYNEYSFLLFPSRFESSGLVALEAMSCGTPVLMTDVGVGVEIKDVIPEFVMDVELWTEQAVLERINLIRENYDDFSRRAREYVLERHKLKDFECQWSALISEYKR